MGSINIWVFLVGTIICCRSLLSAVINWEKFISQNDNNTMYMVEEQRVIDLLMALYHSIVTCMGIWMIIFGGWELFHQKIAPPEITIAFPFVLFVLFIGYLCLRLIFEEAYGLSGYYGDILRSQPNITPKEKTYINDYKTIRRHLWLSIAWMVFLATAIVLAKIFLYLI